MVPVCQKWSRSRTMCACCLCHVRPSVFYLNLGLILPFFFKQKTAYEIMPSLVGSEMCIRDRFWTAPKVFSLLRRISCTVFKNCFYN